MSVCICCLVYMDERLQVLCSLLVFLIFTCLSLFHNTNHLLQKSVNLTSTALQTNNKADVVRKNWKWGHVKEFSFMYIQNSKQ